MCGIAGILAPAVDQSLVDRMTDAIAHRGPDGRGTWVSSCRRVGLGHRRLSILDLSPAGAQPMSTAEQDLTIVFNGEIYNHVELRRQLPDFPYKGYSDTEVILAAYRKWGRSCVERFNGMFAFALWDADRHELFCARDRLGVKPFFYASRNNQWLFGSEVKALLAGGFPANPDMRVWGRYLVHGAFERAHESFFAGVSALPPGHIAVVKPGARMILRRWWYLPEKIAEPWQGSEAEAAEALAELLDDAVRLRLRSDVPVALNLTGGLDSSSVAQSFLRQRMGQQETHVFTAAFDDPRYDEDQYADKVVAGHSCVRHVTRLSPEDVPLLAEEAIRAQEAPFGGIGMIAYETIHREMQALGLKVGLEGQGGDELFAGYSYFRPEALLDILDASRCHDARNFLRATGEATSVVNAARQMLSGHGNFYQDGSSYLAPECIEMGLRTSAVAAEHPRPFRGRLMNALYRDLTETKLVRVLRMNDRKSMAHGVELRQPFLDYRLVEFAMCLPGEMKIKNGYGKYVLRKAMGRRLPDEIVWTKKRPVVTPQREWMQTHLREWVEDLVTDRRFADRGIFDVALVQEKLRNCATENSENTFFIWQWINTELWFREFMDN